MDFDCSKLDDALREDEPELLAAAQAHAASCAACREQLRAWDELSAAARELHAEWDSPELWKRIDAGLPARRPRFSLWSADRSGWRLFLTAAAALVLTISSVWLLRRPATTRPVTTVSRQFLTDQALKEAQDSEAAYIRSIDKLAKLAAPVLDESPSPLIASYREKLTVLDAAIADLKDNQERNRLNARLNTELVSLYHEKQQTLQEVLRYAGQSN